MSEAIKDGDGGVLAEVFSDKKLSTRTVNSTEQQDAVVDGRAYNINTGWETITSNSALLYFENQEDDDADIFIDALALGFKEDGATDVNSVYFVSAPTGGTLYDATTDCSMIANRRIGSGKSLNANTKAYESTATGQTLTGGSDSALFAQNDGGRLYATVDFVLPKGQTCGIRVDVASDFSDDIYAALVIHKRKVL